MPIDSLSHTVNLKQWDKIVVFARSMCTGGCGQDHVQPLCCCSFIVKLLPRFLGKTSVARPETQRTKSSPGKGNETASCPAVPQLFHGTYSSL